MTVTFIGHGYVGLVTAAVFADFGNIEVGAYYVMDKAYVDFAIQYQLHTARA